MLDSSVRGVQIIDPRFSSPASHCEGGAQQAASPGCGCLEHIDGWPRAKVPEASPGSEGALRGPQFDGDSAVIRQNVGRKLDKAGCTVEDKVSRSIRPGRGG